MRHSRATSGWAGRKWALVTLACVFSLAVSLHAADIYKSVDAEGHVIYSDRADGKAAEKAAVRVDSVDPAEVARLAREQQLLQAEESQRQRQQFADDKKKALQDRDQQLRCEAARNQFYAMKEARRIYDRDADGNRVYYSDAEANAKREEARQAMTAACGT
jgi:Domain of unknown function (DUF4124)